MTPTATIPSNPTSAPTSASTALLPPPGPCLRTALSLDTPYPTSTASTAPTAAVTAARVAARGAVKPARQLPFSPPRASDADEQSLKRGTHDIRSLPPAKRLRAVASGGDGLAVDRLGGDQRREVRGATPRKIGASRGGRGRGRPLQEPLLTAEERRRRRTLSNRESAMRSLQKKHDHARRLEGEERLLRERVDLMRAEMRALLVEAAGVVENFTGAMDEEEDNRLVFRMRVVIGRCREALRGRAGGEGVVGGGRGDGSGDGGSNGAGDGGGDGAGSCGGGDGGDSDSDSDSDSDGGGGIGDDSGSASVGVDASAGQDPAPILVLKTAAGDGSIPAVVIPRSEKSLR